MLTCGFFNAVNGDRLYNAEDMCNPYKRIVSNGVFANPDGTPSDDLQVTANGTMQIEVNKGQGLFDYKWSNLDAPMSLTVGVASVSNPRIDSVVFRIDYENRNGSIAIKEGTPAPNPIAPALVRNNTIVEYRLANIRVNANATGITQSNITDTRASADCGFVTHLLQQADITVTYAQWQAQFEEWFQDIKETLSTSTLIRSYTSCYVVTQAHETAIPIQISQFNRNLDILQVFKNGLRLLPETEYTVDNNSQITLINAPATSDHIAFIVYKSIDGSDAETVVQQVYELQLKVDRTKVTGDTGAVKISVTSAGDVLQSFVSAGAGFHTMYSASGAGSAPKTGAFRYFGQMTSATVGWIMALQADGSVYANYYNAGTWTGWKVLHEVNTNALYYSAAGVFPTAGTSITPSKPLSECQHGWQLVFCGYDDVGKAPRDVYVQTYEIPKKNHKQANWNGERMSIPLIYQYVDETDSSLMCQKTLIIYNDRIIGGSTASTGVQRNVVLKAIYEY